jgi:hypothetical protein
MTSQVFTIHATSCSNAVYDLVSAAIPSTSGAMFLASDLWSGHVHGTLPPSNTIRVPKGCDLKIWEASVYGYPAIVGVMASADNGSNYATVKAYAYVTGNATVSSGVYTVKHTGRPVVISSPDGNKRIRINYNTTDGAGVLNNVYADFEVEITESDVY